ncbi:MAG: translation initiation factor IF-2 [Armatimonadota bacterium]
MSKVRVFALAKELGLKSNSLIKALSHLGIDDVTPASAIDDETATAVRELLHEQLQRARERAQAQKKETEEEAPEKAPAKAEEATEEVAETDEDDEVTDIEDLEEELEKEEKKLEEFEQQVRTDGLHESHPGAYMEIEEIEERIAEAREQAEEPDGQEDQQVTPLPELAKRPSGPRPDNAVDIPPVVTVLGHVDHGKTTLLDALRETNVVDGESGGITQHIGASELDVGDNGIVFIDTPGHEAFTALRARGASITDIVILVIAADDGIMPQTVEAINHAKAADVPIVVAINKCDLPAANPERVKQQLLEHELVPEEWGGDTITVEISAEKRENLDELVEMLLLVAEVQELWANPDAEFAGVVVESGVTESEGAVATVLIRNGEIEVGDVVVCGPCHGRVRALRNWLGEGIERMGPGHPVEVVGLGDAPDAGSIMTKAADLQEARDRAEHRAEATRQIQMDASKRAALRELFDGLVSGEVKELNLIVKADVYGSAQALESKLMQLDRKLDQIDITVIAKAVGPVTVSDVMLAKASEAIIIAFRVPSPMSVEQMAEDERVEIRTYEVIYEALDDIVAAASGLLEPIIETRIIGHAQVLQTFKSSRAGVVAGCRVTDGHLEINADIRVLRDGEIVYEGTIDSLRRFENDVRSVDAPNECGVATNDFNNWEVGDQIEASQDIEVEQRISPDDLR